MVRLLAIQNQYPPHHLGGYELWCQDVLERMVARGHEVTVLTSTDRRPGVVDPAGERARAGLGGIDVRRDLPWWWDDHRLTNPPARPRFRQERYAQAVLRSTLDDVRPDVVSVWNMGAMSLGLLTTISRRGTPMVFNVCDDWLVYGPRLDAWLRALDRSPLRRVVGRLLEPLGLPSRLPPEAWPGTYLFVSERTRAAALAARSWSPPTTAITPSGISHADFPVGDGPVVERPWGWRLLCVGRVEPRKGVASAIRALQHLPASATLDVLGPVDPTHGPDLAALVSDLGLGGRVRFDEVSRAELRARYRSADVLIFPPTWEEPFGLVPIEAMACDTPVVATGVGGSADFLADDENCLLFTPDDDVALAGAVRRLAEDPGARRRLVEGGRRTAAWANADQRADDIADWHERSVSSSSVRSAPGVP